MIRGNDQLLSVIDIAIRARCSEKQVYRAIKEGKLTAHKLFGKLVVKVVDYDRFCKVWGNSV